MVSGLLHALLHMQGWQRHKRSGTAHYHSALRKAVPGGCSGCWQRREARKNFFACIFSDEEALS